MLKRIYRVLFNHYGAQGWWPVDGRHFPGDYSYPRDDKERLEICFGAILTQGVSWNNIVKALENLKKLDALNPGKIIRIEDGVLAEAIKPSRYPNQKAKKLKLFSKFYIGLNGKTPTREELLNLWGIGPETADSILLYAYKVPTFVVDAYTKRIFVNLGLIDDKAGYNEIKTLFEKSLEPDYKVFQEYHALIVEHAKRYYKNKDDYNLCRLLKKV